jgi:hypothetical protein
MHQRVNRRRRLLPWPRSRSALVRLTTRAEHWPLPDGRFGPTQELVSSLRLRVRSTDEVWSDIGVVYVALIGGNGKCARGFVERLGRESPMLSSRTGIAFSLVPTDLLVSAARPARPGGSEAEVKPGVA